MQLHLWKFKILSLGMTIILIAMQKISKGKEGLKIDILISI